MYKIEFTQGEWLLDDDQRTYVYVLNEEGNNRIGMYVDRGFIRRGLRTPLEERQATARLVSATPQLFEALVKMLETYDDGEQPHWATPIIKQAYNALDKAVGNSYE